MNMNNAITQGEIMLHVSDKDDYYAYFANPDIHNENIEYACILYDGGRVGLYVSGRWEVPLKTVGCNELTLKKVVTPQNVPHQSGIWG